MKQEKHTLQQEVEAPEAVSPDETAGKEPEKAEAAADEPASASPTEEENPAEPAPAAVDIEALIAEAENRGYLRGRNEQIAMLMNRPGLLERQEAPGRGKSDDTRVMTEGTDPDSSPMILSNPRISIWDR